MTMQCKEMAAPSQPAVSHRAAHCIRLAEICLAFKRQLYLLKYTGNCVKSWNRRWRREFPIEFAALLRVFWIHDKFEVMISCHSNKVALWKTSHINANGMYEVQFCSKYSQRKSATIYPKIYLSIRRKIQTYLFDLFNVYFDFIMSQEKSIRKLIN
jgi:hypothetical protein